MVDFRQRYIKMSIDINGSLGKEGYPLLIRLLKANPDAYTCIFVNFIKECGDQTTIVEDILAENGLDIDVITITGKLEKDDKFGLVRLFTGSLTCEGARPQILIGTGAVNTGIDQRLVKLVLLVGIPHCLETFFQERGRCSRDQELGTFLLCTDWKLFVKLLLTTLNEHKSKNESYNKSTNLARSVIRTPPTDQQARNNRRSNLSAPLTEEEKIRNKR